MDSNAKEALVMVIIGVLIFTIFTGFIGCGNSIFNDGIQHGRVDSRSRGCASACERRGTHMSHIHDADAMCICQNSQTLTLDYGAMYRPVSE